jgi:hypothetical protein
VIETALGQVLPVFIARKLGLSTKVQMLFSIVVFAAGHVTNGDFIRLVPGIVGGFYLSFTYLLWKKRNDSIAYLLTTVLHCCYNGMILSVIFIQRLLR